MTVQILPDRAENQLGWVRQLRELVRKEYCFCFCRRSFGTLRERGGPSHYLNAFAPVRADSKQLRAFSVRVLDSRIVSGLAAGGISRSSSTTRKTPNWLRFRSAGFWHTTRYSTRIYLKRSGTCSGSVMSGCKATTRNGRMTRSGRSLPCSICRGQQNWKSLATECVPNGEAYAPTPEGRQSQAQFDNIWIS